jgi:hypothetical protein
MQYDDLMELAQLCSLRATVRRTAAVAGTLRGMAVEYRARAYGLVASRAEVAIEVSIPRK